MKKWNKGSRWQVATICEKEEGNFDQHWRVEPKTVIISGKKSTGLQDAQEDPRAGIREASTWDDQQVSENEELDVVERSAPSKTKKEIMHGVRAGHVGAPATPGVIAPPGWKRERERERERGENFG
jgi:hypothetical protein